MSNLAQTRSDPSFSVKIYWIDGVVTETERTNNPKEAIDFASKDRALSETELGGAGMSLKEYCKNDTQATIRVYIEQQQYRSIMFWVELFVSVLFFGVLIVWLLIWSII